ncbi:hypothetical protein ACWFRJ_43270 [Streptomyces sp. NPDC055239]
MSLGERQRITLLEWVEELTQDSQSEVVDAETWAMRTGVPDMELRSLVHSLTSEGFLTDPGIDQGRYVSLAPAGVTELQAVRVQRSNRLERNNYVRNVILRWLYDHQEERTHSLSDMIDDPAVHFYGDALTSDEVARAFTYLRELSMVKGKRSLGGDAVAVSLMARGIECVESEKPVADFINPQQHSGGNVYNTYLPNAQGVIVGEQRDFTQNNKAGIDPSAFIQLAGYLGQVSATLGLEESDRAELERTAQELHTAATSGSPKPGRLRALTSRIVDGLSDAAGTIAGQVAVRMGQEALGSLGGHG